MWMMPLCRGIIHISGPPFRYPKCIADLIPFQSRCRKWKDRHMERNLNSCHSMLEANVTKNIKPILLYGQAYMVGGTMHGSRGGERGSGPPLENHKIYGFLKKQAFGPPSKKVGPPRNLEKV